jgi:hypothetical protein
VRARWEDIVAFTSALVLQLRGDHEAAVVALRELVDNGFATGRVLNLYQGSFVLVDVLVDRGDVVEADAVLGRAEGLLEGSEDPFFVGPLRARRVRLLRLAGRREDAVSMLETAEKFIDHDALTPEHRVCLVEHALLTDDPDERRMWVDRLEDMSRRTGVIIPPWERRLLAALDGPG